MASMQLVKGLGWLNIYVEGSNDRRRGASNEPLPEINELWRNGGMRDREDERRRDIKEENEEPM